MKYSDLLSKLKKKEFAPVYLLHGEEPYYVDVIADIIENTALDETEKSFNLTLLYGKDSDAKTVAESARRYPVMASRQVIIVREAETMKDLDELDAYCANPVSSTVLVLCHKHKKYDGRKKLATTVNKTGVVFESAKLYDNQISAWIHDYVADQKGSIQPQAAQMLAEYLGTDLGKLANEMNKLFLNLASGETITTKTIEDNIGISKDFNVFELQTAFAKRDYGKIALIVNYFAANPKENPIQLVNAFLYGYFSNLYVGQHFRDKSDKDLVGALFMRDAKPEEVNSGWKRMEWKLRDIKPAMQNYSLKQTEDIIALLAEYDLKSKGVGADGSDNAELVKEMIWRMVSV